MSIDIMHQLPVFIAWKDSNFLYQGCNNNLSSFLQFRHAEEIIGLSDYDLHNQTHETIAFHRKHDREAIKGNTIKTLHKSEITTCRDIYFQVKKPLIADGTIQGIIFYCHEFVDVKIFMQLLQTDKNNCAAEQLPLYYEITPKTNPYHLSTRELECLFYTLRGMSAKKTAECLDLSKRTVEFYLENIKNKFTCQKKSELIAAAIECGYMNYLPEQWGKIAVA